MVIGASGMLGTIVAQHLKAQKRYELVECSRSGTNRLDLSDKQSFLSALATFKPKSILNLAALADVDGCERDPFRAYTLNALTCENLSLAVKEGINVVHISTDQVYSEAMESSEAEVTPLNYYSYSKLLGECYLKGATILRTNFFGKSLNQKKSFSDWIFQELTSRREINLFSDSFFSPLNMDHLAQNLELTLNNFFPGTYNLGSHSGMSKLDFGLSFAKHLNLDQNLIKFSKTEEAKLFARRPLDMRMNVTHFENTFKVRLPTLESLILEESKKYVERV